MNHFSFSLYSHDTKDIILQMLTKNPELRISPEEALQHKFFTYNGFGKAKKTDENFEVPKDKPTLQ